MDAGRRAQFRAMRAMAAGSDERRAAWDALVRENVGLVDLVVRRLAGKRPKHLEEQRSAGLWGLAAAVRDYDPERPARFSTLAYRYIRNELYNWWNTRRNRPFEVQMPGEPQPLFMALAHPAADIERHEADRMFGLLPAALACLPDRERIIITLRHLTEPPWKLADLGLELKVNKERVRQLELRALEKMGRKMGESQKVETSKGETVLP